MTKYVIMVINQIFEGENMLIAKWNGGTITKRYDEIITVEMLHEFLEDSNMPVDSCDINVVDESWKGNPRITRY